MCSKPLLVVADVISPREPVLEPGTWNLVNLIGGVVAPSHYPPIPVTVAARLGFPTSSRRL